MKKKADKTDKLIEQLYYIHGNGVQIGIMSITAIFREAREAHALGQDMDKAMIRIINHYRTN